jgi:RHS repeat-associated protein
MCRTYYRDTRDRITAFQKSSASGGNPMENGHGDRFRYDAEGQLTDSVHGAADYGGNPAGGQRWEHFNYDALGNRSGSNIVGLRGWLNFSRRDNGLNQYSSWDPSVIYHDDNYPGRSAPGNGVMMADGWVTASYNALNQPIAIWSPAYNGTSNFMWFEYDPLGRCVKRWVGPLVNGGNPAPGTNPATYLYYDGWNLLKESGNPWTADRLYIHGGRVDEIVKSINYPAGGQVAYHHYDARGHCTMLTDSSGNILEQYEYDSFGLPYFYNASGAQMNSSSYGNRFLFTGREWLSDLHLYDYRNRLYQPELGRFMQPDPKEFGAGDYNLYRYCHNDPVNHSDPTGLISLTSLGGGDGNWFNGGVALAQIAAQQAATSHRFAPTLAKDGKTAVPSEQNNRGGIYRYQFKAPDGRRVTGPGYTVLEKITDRQGSFPMKTQTEEMPLARNGIFTDDVGLDFRPSRSYNGFSQVKQSFEVKHNGQPVEVSTVLGHKVTVEDGNVTPSVWVIRP